MRRKILNGRVLAVTTVAVLLALALGGVATVGAQPIESLLSSALVKAGQLLQQTGQRYLIVAGSDGTNARALATDATGRAKTITQAGVATVFTSDTVGSAADDTIAAVAGQQAVCVQSLAAAGVLCVGGVAGTGPGCASNAVKLKPDATDSVGGAVCVPTTASLTVGASVVGPLSYVWWRI